jgi:hypothetical protein
MRPYLEKTLHKKGLVEWLKAWALSPGSSTLIKKKKLFTLSCSLSSLEDGGRGCQRLF